MNFVLEKNIDENIFPLRFENIEIGEIFLYANEFYMATETINDCWNTVRLNSGSLHHFDNDENVYKLDKEINIFYNKCDLKDCQDENGNLYRYTDLS